MSQSLLFMPLFPDTLLVGMLQNKQNTESAKICLNLSCFFWGGYSEVKYSKCQDLPKFQFSGGGGGKRGYSGVKYSKCQDLPKFQFSGAGGGVF